MSFNKSCWMKRYKHVGWKHKLSLVYMFTCFKCKVNQGTSFWVVFLLSNNDGGFVPKGSYCLVCGTYICEKVIELLAGHLPVMSDLYFPCLIFYFIHCPVLLDVLPLPWAFWMSFLLCFFIPAWQATSSSLWMAVKALHFSALYTRILKFETQGIL